MPTLRHRVTGATWDVPAGVVDYWSARTEWELVREQAPARRRSRRRAPRPAPSSTPTVQGGDPGDPTTGSSTTEQTKE